MSAPWTYDLDSDGPCNGDVVVKTARGKLVAVFFAAGSDEKTLARARSFCRAQSPQHCSTCGKSTAEGVGDTCAKCQRWLADNPPPEPSAAFSEKDIANLCRLGGAK